jgi:hypothetical protein
VIVRALLAAAALIAIPIAVQGAENPSQRPDDTTTKVCEVNLATGSRLGGVRRCRTRAEREQAKQEARRVVDRMQAFKPTMCAPPRPAC